MPYTGKKVEKEATGKQRGPGKYRFSVTRFETRTSKKGNTWWSYDLKLYAAGDNEGFEAKYLSFFESSQDSLDAFLTVIGCTEAGIPFLKADEDVKGKHGVVLVQEVEELDRDDDTKIWLRLTPLRWGAWYSDDELSANEMNAGKEAESIMKNMEKCDVIEKLWGKDKSRYEAASMAPAASPSPKEDDQAEADVPF